MIDAHIHFWRRSEGYTIWPTEKFGLLDRDFQPQDLADAYGGLLPDFIIVQAAEDVEETRGLLKLAASIPNALGVVGWIDVEDADIAGRIDELLPLGGLLGFRLVFPKEGEKAKSDIRRLAGALVERNLVLELLASPGDLADIAGLANELPDLKLNINHCGRPLIYCADFESWAENVLTLGGCKNISCKLSGLVERAGMTWQTDDLQPYVRHVLKTFGANRTIYASNWPVLGIAGRADTWLSLCRQEVEFTLGSSALKDVFRGSAVKFYGL